MTYLSVYEGRTKLGHVELIGERWHAALTGGYLIGTYATRTAALVAFDALRGIA
jgi:hypothetical protein